jgi:hypothetical protein
MRVHSVHRVAVQELRSCRSIVVSGSSGGSAASASGGAGAGAGTSPPASTHSSSFNGVRTEYIYSPLDSEIAVCEVCLACIHLLFLASACHALTFSMFAFR